MNPTMLEDIGVQISPREFRAISAYCAEEVRRQGDTPLHVGYMIDAMLDAIEHQYHGDDLSLDMIKHWARLIEPVENRKGFRTVDVVVGGVATMRPEFIDMAMQDWIEARETLAPNVAYKTFEEIHPFMDGNGRTGKVILNFINGTLLNPIWPYNWWGISNP